MKFVLIAILVLWLLSKALKYLFRFILLMAGKELQKEMHRQQGTPPPQAKPAYGGNVHVMTDTSQKRKDFDQGEYIDFEEVK